MLYPAVILAILDDAERTFMEQLYCDLYDVMMAQAYEVLGDRQHIEDAIDDGLLSLIDKIKILQSMECPVLTAYVVITIKNAAIDLGRRSSCRQNRNVHDPDAALETVAAEQPGVDAGLIRAAELQAMWRAIDKLPEDQGRMLEMKYGRNLSDAQIARAFGIKPESVRKALLRARRKALQLIQAEEGEHER